MSLAGFAVAPGPPDLLIIGFQAARQIRMEKRANVGFVDAHAESNGLPPSPYYGSVMKLF